MKMASTSTSQAAAGAATASSTQEFVVRLPTTRQRKLSMLKFASSLKVDFTKMGETAVKMERENNFREYKTANDVDMMPKFGAGSEFGREQKEEARRKKYGIVKKRYNPEGQPWLMKIGAGKQTKKFKGVREGSVSENTSYYIFTQCPDGAFEATPVEEWYNFTPVIKYKYLNSDEAEEEFSRRDKIMNYFNVMMKKRIKNEGDKEADGEEAEKVTLKKSKKKGKDFLLTDLDEWADLSDEDEEEEDEEGKEKDKKDDDDDDDSKGKKKKKKGGKGEVKKKRKNAKNNSDDEAVEESDEGDFDDREVDYMTGSDSSLSGAEDRDKMDKYEEKGVAEEKGLRKLIDSEEDSDEEETNKEENEEEKEETTTKKEGNDSDSDSSKSSSASDSDIEKDENLSSALFMQKKSGDKKKNSDKAPSRSATPNSIENEEKLTARKRKLEPEASSSKRSRTDSPITTSQSSSEGITEDSIRRYLVRKPMTTKDLLQKFKSKKINMTTEQMASTIAQLLKRINPERQYVNEVLYLSIKTPG